MRSLLHRIGLLDRRNPHNHQRGQSLVELALTLPLMTMILMGIIDLSFVLFAHVQVATAAREGARVASLFPGDFNLSADANDNARRTAVRKIIYDSGTGSTAMGLLSTSLPSFDVTSDQYVRVEYDPVVAADPINNSARRGEDVIVTVTYKQRLWFDFLPTSIPDNMPVSTTVRMRIQ